MFVGARSWRPALPGQERAGSPFRQNLQNLPALAGWRQRDTCLFRTRKKQVLLTPSATGLQTSGKLMLRHRGPFATQPKAAREYFSSTSV